MTELVFWTRQIGGPPSYNQFPEEQAAELLQYAYKKWIRIFDTAPIYWCGRSEELIWKYLSEERKNIKIITKFWFQFDKEWNTFFDFSGRWIKEQLQKSLERLQTNYVDTYLLHIPSGNMDINEIITTLNECKRKKLIGSYGLCNSYENLLKSFLEHPQSQIESIQDFYNLIERKAEKLIFPYLNETHKFMAYSPLYRGLLTDINVKELLEKDEWAINRLMKNDDLPFIVKKRKVFEIIATRKWVSLAKLAMDFLSINQRVNHVLFGTTNEKHLETMIDLI